MGYPNDETRIVDEAIAADRDYAYSRSQRTRALRIKRLEWTKDLVQGYVDRVRKVVDEANPKLKWSKVSLPFLVKLWNNQVEL